MLLKTVSDTFSTIQREVDALAQQGLYRSWRSVEALDGGRIQVDGRWLIHMASNSYLGLHQHPQVIEAAKEALDRYGAGVGSARLIGGTFPLHEELEHQIASFKQTEAALLFSAGYMANLGVVTALVGPGDLVIGDHLNHASLVDACRLSRATFRVYPHRDVERLDSALKGRSGKFRRLLVVTEGVFSMDGDIAPLPEIVEVARRYGAWLLVDDAHATGVLGPNGRGSLEHFGLSSDGILQMGTLSKALGSLGGFLAGPRPVIELLKNKARSFIYTTALPAASCAAALASLRVMEHEPMWRRRLWKNVTKWSAALRQMGLELISAESPIIPIRVGLPKETMNLSRALFKSGVYAPGIRPPTVPVGSARIRTSLTALHTEEDVDVALDVVRNVFAKTTVPGTKVAQLL